MKVAALVWCDARAFGGAPEFMGRPVLEMVVERLKGVDGIEPVIFCPYDSYEGPFPDSTEILRREGQPETEVIKRIFDDSGADHIVKVFADSPFLDAAVIQEMLDVHLSCLPEYTYSENLPQGFTAEIISGEIVESLPGDIAEGVTLNEVVRAHLHQFDVEIFYRDPDVRDSRMSFRSSSKRDRKVMENMVARHGCVPSYGEIRGIINSSPELLYVGPSYLEVELTGRCSLDCVFCYRNTLKHEHPDMDMDVLKSALLGMREFDLPYSVCLGGSGEPMVHPSFYRALDMVLSEQLVQALVVETSGTSIDSNFVQYCEKHAAGKLRVIVNICGHDVKTYAALHGADMFEKVSAGVDALNAVLGGRGGLFLQVMKINETDPFLDSYYDFWEAKKIPIILQKQNVYLGRIPDRRYSDLSPLERTPCWHLLRDLYVLSDGTVTFCKQDVEGTWPRGTLRESSLRDIYEKGKDAFIRDYSGKYPSSPDCASCDEWYTFNM